MNIRAKNGVVMTMGGFENNKQMVEDFLGLTKSTPAGTLFNTGDGVKMAMGVGADLWHMEAYEGNCFALGGISFVVNEDQHAKTFNDCATSPAQSSSWATAASVTCARTCTTATDTCRATATG